jgi:hypothetical protein
MNLLLYLNKDWKPEYKGHLKLHDRRSGEETELEVPFNRMIIQQTRAYTLHGYDQTHFPEGKYRTSIATYAYTPHKQLVEKPRTTDWFAKKDKPLKRIISTVYGPAVKLKKQVIWKWHCKKQIIHCEDRHSWNKRNSQPLRRL